MSRVQNEECEYDCVYVHYAWIGEGEWETQMSILMNYPTEGARFFQFSLETF